MKVLLVRLSSMGDLIHTLPAITDLAQHRPDIELHWLCETAFADIARLHPFVQKVHEMSWRQWRKQLLKSNTIKQITNLKQQLKLENFDLIIDSQGLIKSALFARMAKAPIYGLDKNSAREPLATTFYQQQFIVNKDQDAVWRNRQLFAQAFGYITKDKADFGIQSSLSGSLKTNFPSDYFVALHATSRDDKLWPLDHWLDLLTQLHEHDDIEVLLPWGNETERIRAQTIANKLPFAQVCPKLTLLEAAKMLANARAVIGVDTGLLHLANATDTPVVGIYTASDPNKTGVQPSLWATNLGGIGKIPEVSCVYMAVLTAIQQKINAYNPISRST